MLVCDWRTDIIQLHAAHHDNRSDGSRNRKTGQGLGEAGQPVTQGPRRGPGFRRQRRTYPRRDIKTAVRRFVLANDRPYSVVTHPGTTQVPITRNTCKHALDLEFVGLVVHECREGFP